MTTLIFVYNDHAHEMGQNITSSGLDTRRRMSRCSAFTNPKRDKRAGRRDLPRHDGPP